MSYVLKTRILSRSLSMVSSKANTTKWKTRVEDDDMVLNQLEEYDWIKMELITLWTEAMVYRQKIKLKKVD
jgi:hypothetical protein